MKFFAPARRHAGIPVVDPLDNYVQRFQRGEGGLFDRGQSFAPDETLTPVSLNDVEIALWELFELPEPGTVPPAKGPEEWRRLASYPCAFTEPSKLQ